jgi:hypothetical protein
MNIFKHAVNVIEVAFLTRQTVLLNIRHDLLAFIESNVHWGLVIGPGPITRPPLSDLLTGCARYQAGLFSSVRAKNGPITNHIV